MGDVDSVNSQTFLLLGEVTGNRVTLVTLVTHHGSALTLATRLWRMSPDCHLNKTVFITPSPYSMDEALN